MKICRDCEYFVDGEFCSAPQNGINLVTGNPTVVIAAWARKNASGRCGKEGKYFTPAPPLVEEKACHWLRLIVKKLVRRT